MKTICGSDEPHPYPTRSFTYRNEKVRTDKLKRVIEYKANYILYSSITPNLGACYMPRYKDFVF